ncbi:hypothetical protein J2W28_000989 [Variovorax boronicumulans]|uniref:hypothetical protein n=1 Tax=Variovorax boronicumulans TaxID=436515 RepID=UPI00278882DA|nr:hypothetical protein [Variovorax boronicumulans]MDP9991961.1 hypothetical protein [Variovorax boronicumulans]MDQ0001856.1 hypothetical protein [Variovorax boronicumulans]
MTITVLSDVIVPKSVIMAGIEGRTTRQNDRSVNQGGYATTNVVRDVTMREYTLGVKPMALSAWESIVGIYEATDAGAYGMLLEDPTDALATNAQGAFQGYMSGVEFGTPGRGNGTPLYGLRKLYTAFGSSRTRARIVTRPKGTPSMLRGGSPVVVGVAAGNVALSVGPVYAAFVADATRTVTAVTPGATTQVTLNTAIPGFVVSGRLWLQGLTGADAALLNGKSHEITAITGGGLNVYTLATNTAGKAITAAGQGHKYPQPDETLSWSGGFYVPVQFSNDTMDWDLIRPGHYEDRLIAGPNVPLVEVREA